MGMMIHRHKLKLQRAVEQTAPVVEENVTETKEETVVEEAKEVEKKKYTKTEIARLSTLELQTLANNEGIENAFETSGTDLKKILIEHFGL